MKIVFTGGGTAGHIFPILAVVRQVRKTLPTANITLFYIGPADAYTAALMGREGVKVKRIITGKLRRYFSIKNFFDLFKVPIGLLQALLWLFFLAPDLIFSKGGYGSFPVAFMSRILHIPVFLHESDIAPGLTSRITSRWALEIFTSFPKTEYFPKEKIMCVGNPIRIELISGSKKEAQKIFRLQGKKPLILILGGSQGAQSINNLVLEILPELTTSFELLHQTGPDNFKEVKNESEALIGKQLKKYYHLYPFFQEEELKHALAASDFIISRAGSGALFEIASVKKPALLIPLPRSANNHQSKNAYSFAKDIKGQVLEEENLKPHFFLERLKYFLSRPDILREMAENGEKFAKPKAAQVVANYIIEYLYQTFEIVESREKPEIREREQIREEKREEIRQKTKVIEKTELREKTSRLEEPSRGTKPRQYPTSIKKL